MINKIYSLINNKFSRLFRFIFFLRYLFLIFFIAIAALLSIPHFFDYKIKEKFINLYLLKNYSLEVQKIESIKFKSFPTPHLEIDQATLDFYSSNIDLKTQKMKIYPEIYSIFNYENFKVRKIKLIGNDLELDLKKINLVTKKIYNLEKKIALLDLNITLKDNKTKIITFRNINFFNYGYKRNKINGEVFKKKLIVNLRDNLSAINFKLLNSGFSGSIKISEKTQSTPIAGSFKAKILKSKIKFDFNYDKKSIKVKNFYFRDKNLSLDSEGKLDIRPFFKLYLSSKINDINLSIIKIIDINNLLKAKDLIRRLNIQKIIIFEPNKFEKKIVDYLDIKLNLAYGRLNILKKLSISKSNFICNTNLNLLDLFPIASFNCVINSPDKKKLLKKLKINYKDRNKPIIININGNLNILNNKINFDKIELNNNKFNKEDLKYYKSTFENILFDKNFIQIFKLPKIQKFIAEIS